MMGIMPVRIRICIRDPFPPRPVYDPKAGRHLLRRCIGHRLGAPCMDMYLGIVSNAGLHAPTCEFAGLWDCGRGGVGRWRGGDVSTQQEYTVIWLLLCAGVLGICTGFLLAMVWIMGPYSESVSRQNFRGDDCD